MACRLFGAKPLSKPMLGGVNVKCCHFDETLVTFCARSCHFDANDENIVNMATIVVSIHYYSLFTDAQRTCQAFAIVVSLILAVDTCLITIYILAEVGIRDARLILWSVGGRALTGKLSASITGHLWGESTGRFPSQRDSNGSRSNGSDNIHHMIYCIQWQISRYTKAFRIVDEVNGCMSDDTLWFIRFLRRYFQHLTYIEPSPINTIITLGNPFAYRGINIMRPFCYLHGKCSFRLI